MVKVVQRPTMDEGGLWTHMWVPVFVLYDNIRHDSWHLFNPLSNLSFIYFFNWYDNKTDFNQQNNESDIFISINYY